MLERNRVHFERYGFGFWAAVVKTTHEFAGVNTRFPRSLHFHGAVATQFVITEIEEGEPAIVRLTRNRLPSLAGA